MPKFYSGTLFWMEVYKLPLILSVGIIFNYQLSIINYQLSIIGHRHRTSDIGHRTSDINTKTKLRVLYQGPEFSPEFPNQGKPSNCHPYGKCNPDSVKSPPQGLT